MTGNELNDSGTKKHVQRSPRSTQWDDTGPMPAAVSLLRAGDWLPADELRVNALQAVQTMTDLSLDLADVDHLDASALQILLALAEDRREKGLQLHLLNASPLLRQWFQFAGTPPQLFPTLPGQP